MNLKKSDDMGTFKIQCLHKLKPNMLKTSNISGIPFTFPGDLAKVPEVSRTDISLRVFTQQQ